MPDYIVTIAHYPDGNTCGGKMQTPVLAMGNRFDDMYRIARTLSIKYKCSTWIEVSGHHQATLALFSGVPYDLQGWGTTSLEDDKDLIALGKELLAQGVYKLPKPIKKGGASE